MNFFWLVITRVCKLKEQHTVQLAYEYPWSRFTTRRISRYTLAHNYEWAQKSYTAFGPFLPNLAVQNWPRPTEKRPKRQDASAEDELTHRRTSSTCLERQTAVSDCSVYRLVPIWSPDSGGWESGPHDVKAVLSVTSEAHNAIWLLFLRTDRKLRVHLNLSHKRQSFYLITVCVLSNCFSLFHLKSTPKRRCTDRDSLR